MHFNHPSPLASEKGLTALYGSQWEGAADT